MGPTPFYGARTEKNPKKPILPWTKQIYVAAWLWSIIIAIFIITATAAATTICEVTTLSQCGSSRLFPQHPSPSSSSVEVGCSLISEAVTGVVAADREGLVTSVNRQIINMIFYRRNKIMLILRLWINIQNLQHATSMSHQRKQHSKFKSLHSFYRNS